MNSAPTAPPSYDTLNNQQNGKTPMGYQPSPGQYNYSPSHHPQHQTVYVQQQYGQQPISGLVQVQALPPLGPQPANVTCPNCGQAGLTEVRFENATKTHIMALLLCVFGLCCCAPIPYCVDSCRNANHYCKSCQQYLGTHLNNSC